MSTLRGKYSWLARAAGGEAQQATGEVSLEQAKADAARWTLVSRLSSKLPGAQGAQAAQQSSASGHSTPSNLERAVLLLEAETESASGESKVSAVASAVSSPTQAAGDREPESSAPGVIYTADVSERLDWSSAPRASSQQKPGDSEMLRSAIALDDDRNSPGLEEQRSALRKVNIGEDSKPGHDTRDCFDEGPSTPPASSAAARADTKASSSPNSTAGMFPLSM